MECLLPYLCVVTVPHIMVRLECWIIEVSDYRDFTDSVLIFYLLTVFY